MGWFPPTAIPSVNVNIIGSEVMTNFWLTDVTIMCNLNDVQTTDFWPNDTLLFCKLVVPRHSTVVECSPDNLKVKSSSREDYRGKYHCTVDLLFDWFGISCMIIDNFFSKQNNPNQSNRRSMVQ
jgi:hypothetical protein